MAETSKNKIYYNNDENSIANILADMKKLAESADNAIETKVDKVSGKKLSTNDFTNEYKNKLDELNNYDDTKIKEKLEELKEENERLKEDLNALPTVQGSGEYITLDTAECRFKNFHIEGNSKQETTEGKNKFNLNYIEQSTAKVVTDTGVNLTNCWGTQAFNNEKVLKTFKPNTTYTMKAKAKVVSRPSTQGAHQTATFLLYREGSSPLGLVAVDLIKMKDKETIALNTEKEYITTFTTPADLSELRILTYSFYGNNDGSTTYAPSGEIDLTDIMLVEGTYTAETFPEYEQYGVMPSPEFPSEIKNVGDNINIFNKNANAVISGISKTVLDTGVRITQAKAGNYRYGAFKIGEDNLLGKKLVLSTKMQASANNQPRVVFYFGSPTAAAVQQIGSELTTSGSMTINIPSSFPDGCDRIYLLFYSNREGTGNVGDYVDYTDLKLEVGNRPTLYSDYNCGNIPIKVQNENLLSLTEGKADSGSGVTVKELEDGGINITGTVSSGSNFVYIWKLKNIIKKNQLITLSNGTTGITGFQVSLRDSSKKVISETWTNNGASKSATLTTDAYYYQIQINSNTTINTTIYPQIVQGATTKPYIKHQEQTKVFPLAEGQKLMKGDYLADDGIHHQRKQIVLNGTEYWELGTSGFFLNESKKNFKDRDITNFDGYCNYFNVEKTSQAWTTKNYCGWSATGTFWIKEDFEIADNINDFKTWLASQYEKGTPVIVEYELLNEIIEPYTEQQKIQWEQIKNTRSYEGQTNIFSIDETSPIFNITARANLNEILNKLQGE